MKFIYENVVFGFKCYGMKNKKEIMECVEKSLCWVVFWDEVKDDLGKSVLFFFGG